MPPRKSNVSAHSSGDGEDAPTVTNGIGVEDLQLPRSMIQRISKGVLPPNTSIQKEALIAISKSATVFVNYLTSTSNEYTMRAGKKSVLARDVLEAVNELEFGEFLPRLEAELQKYIAIQCDKRNSYRAGVRVRKRASEAGVATSDGATVAADGSPAVNGNASHLSVSSPTLGDSNGLRNGPGTTDSIDGEPAAKRPRRSKLSNGTDVHGAPVNGEGGVEGDEEELVSEADVLEEEGEGQEDEEGEEGEDEGEGEEEGEESGREEDGLREDPIEVDNGPNGASSEEDEDDEDSD